MKKVLNIAHRGFSGAYPENTMLAFRKAVEIGADGIETDLQMTKDGVIVICHDEKLDRTTDGSGLIKEYTYDELLKFDAGIKYREAFKGERIPTIDEFFDYVKDKNIFINLELKNSIINYEGLEKRVIDKIYEYKLEKSVILSSFNHYSMVKVKEYDHNIKTGLLCAATLYNPGKYVKDAGADAYHPFFPSVMDKSIVAEIKSEGIMINTYTVNKIEYMDKLISLGIDGIITNYPDKLIAK
ncbi:glycerophosphodiester phosphodiesterase [Clostridium neuense]|uniref:Glycerophosphodiester phosphodiesterase n=1 Tax=Clostridium neuense TaxID=1728934 RepID=A0ABW8TIY7_9CLOT